MNDSRVERRLRITVPVFLTVSCLMALGCSSYGSVSGKVSYRGAPVGGGSVLFYAEGQDTARSEIGPDGAYKIDKIPIGPVKIAVETKSAKPTVRPAGMPPPPPDAKDASASPLYNPQNQPNGKYVAIPDDYADFTKSGLDFTVTGGSQPHDIDLK